MSRILDHVLITERYFFPRNEPVSDPRLVQTRDGCLLSCAHLNPQFDRTVLHFHGNGETASDWEPILGPFFADLEWSLLLVEYRGYGGSQGFPQLAGMLPDGEDVLREVGIDPARAVAFGRSIGSLYAVELAVRQPLAGLILESGIHDLAERVLLRASLAELGTSRDELDREIGELFDQSAKLTRYGGPTLLLHTRDDQLVSVAHAQRNARACRRPTLCLFDRGGHNAIYPWNRAAYQAALEQFLRQIPAL